jgi:hypothetical protein
VAYQLLETTVDWLIGARSPAEQGWGLGYRKAPSVTVTSEVLLSLRAAQASPFWRQSTLDTQVNEAIATGLTFLQDRLPTHRNPDLPNYALALMAHLRTSKNVDQAFVTTCCLPGILGFRDGIAWKTKKEARKPSTFATCLAALALQELLVSNRQSQLLDLSTTDEVKDAFEKAQHYIFTIARIADVGAWSDEDSSQPKGHPAITALALHVRTAYFETLGTSLAQDPIAQAACAYLCSMQDLILHEWSYRLQQSDYHLFYIAYVVTALSKHLDVLDAEALRFFYKTAQLLTSDAMRLADDRGLFAGCIATPNTNEAFVWATAHSLTALSSLPITQRELKTLRDLIDLSAEQGARIFNLQKQVGEQGDALLAQHQLRWGKEGANYWARISPNLFLIAMIVVLVALAVLGRLEANLFVKWSSLAGVAAVSFYCLFRLYRLHSPTALRALLDALVLTCAIIGIAWFIIDFPVTIFHWR